MTTTPTTPTSGAADLPEALIGAIMAAAYDFRDAHISGSKNLKRTAHAELESTVRNTLHALAAGQATAAQAVVQDLITIRKPTTAADGKTELFNLPGYPLMVRAVDFNRIHSENEMLKHALFDPVSVEAALAAQGEKDAG